MATNLAIGKGELHFAPYKPNSQTPDGFYFVGNCPEITLNREADLLPHYDSTRGFRRKDEEITIESRMTGSVSCDDVRPQTAALFLMGQEVTLTVASATGLSTLIVGARRGRSYQLGETLSQPSGARQVTNVEVSLTLTPATVYVLGTDYTIDAALGLITILPGSTIAENANLTVEFDQTAHTRPQIIASDNEAQGALKYISYNPIGQRLDYFFPWVKVRPNGDISLISEEWMTIPLSIEALYKDELSLCYLDGRPLI
jgi:hypothetical protein